MTISTYRFWLSLVLLSALGTAATPTKLQAVPPETPQHPAVEASDSEWDRWRMQNASWLKDQVYAQRRDAGEALAKPEPANATADEWRLEARYRGLTLGQINQLASGGVVATGRSYVMSEKLERPLDGVFVTSDMMVHAYNMMAADFVRGMEMQRAPRLRRQLERMWWEIAAWPMTHDVPANRAEPSVAHVQRVIGTALLCLGSTIEFKNPAVERDCRAQLELILAASAVQLPEWLGPADGDFIGIDYQRMKPVGFYPENETLSRLFRAVRWLQVVPFRPERDIELLAFAILAETAETSGLAADDLLQRQWLGLPNVANVTGQAWMGKKAGEILRKSAGAPDFSSLREELAKSASVIHANDDRRFDPKLSGKPEPLPLLKFTPAYLTADSLVISDVVTAASGRLPEGRMIIAFLGDEAALGELGHADWNDNVLEVLRHASARRGAAWASDLSAKSAMNPYDDRTTFNSMLLHTWSALFLPPPVGAPPFLSGPAWRAKSRNTVLAAWAEKRHTWVLHEVEPMGYTGGHGPPPPPPGLIEPNPEFYRRLACLAEQTRSWMAANGFVSNSGLREEARAEAAARLLFARRLHEHRLDTEGNTGNKISWEDFLDEISRQGVPPEYLPSEAKWLNFKAMDFAKLKDSIAQSSEMILQGLDANSQPEELEHPPVNRHWRWTALAECARKLEKLSEKQLRGEEWSDEEKEYLTHGIWNDYYLFAFYGDNGMKPDPKSLGPKIAPVASDPNTGEVLHVGTGDMAELYVLYPWKGTSHLYRGPIIPYYELPFKVRLNDEEWRALLKSDQPPQQPAWLDPMRAR